MLFSKLALFFLLITLLTSCSNGNQEDVITYTFIPTLKEAMGEARYVRNQITPRGIAELKQKYNNMPNKATWLYIESSGGDIVDGMTLAEWVLEKKLNVKVIGKGCFSSCANYVFPAGRKREVAKGSIVAWHGSAMSGSYYAKLLDKAVSRAKDYYYNVCASNAMHDPDGKVNCQQGAEWNMKHVANTMLEKAKADALREKALFDKMGVNACITVVGQRVAPRAKDFWFLSEKDMATFGLSAVLPDQYEKTDTSSLNVSIELIDLQENSEMTRCTHQASYTRIS
ncbi:ATP-dependent Clp protease proteolytic subunit [Chitinimonas sp. PSY-7]|uniref:ATP-dependent Clp protease proteolytic subunit n=1 Tax=Chitinimonas sp. PSY-7 TaxID=3459088 RepID=UPI0040401098